MVRKALGMGLVVLVGVLSFDLCLADCIDYHDYLHWVGTVKTPSVCYGVDVSGSYAYVAEGDAGLQVIDVTDPAAPAIVGSVDTPGAPVGVAVQGSYAYVADNAAGFQVIDITNP